MKDWTVNFVVPVMVVIFFSISTISSFASSVFPQFTLKNPVEDQVLNTESFQGNLVFLYFFSIEDEKSPQNFDLLMKSVAAYTEQGLQVKAIAIETSEIDVLRFIARHNPDIEVLMPHGDTHLSPGKTNLPMLFLLNSHGLILYKNSGSVTENFDNEIKVLLSKDRTHNKVVQKNTHSETPKSTANLAKVSPLVTPQNVEIAQNNNRVSTQKIAHKTTYNDNPVPKNGVAKKKIKNTVTNQTKLILQPVLKESGAISLLPTYKKKKHAFEKKIKDYNKNNNVNEIARHRTEIIGKMLDHNDKMFTYSTTLVERNGQIELAPKFIFVKNWSFPYKSYLYNLDNGEKVIDNVCNLPEEIREKRCSPPQIIKYDKDNFLIYFNNKYETNYPSDSTPNYTYLYNDKTKEIVLIDGMLVAVQDLNGDKKSEIITYSHPHGQSGRKSTSTITAYSLNQTPEKKMLINKFSSGNLKFTFLGVRDWIPDGVSGKSSSWPIFIWDEQMSRLFLQYKKKTRKERKERDEKEFERSRLRNIPSSNLESLHRTQVKSLPGRPGFDTRVFIAFKDFKNFKIKKNDRERMIFDSLSNFSCADVGIDRQYFCDSTDGYSNGDMKLANGTTLHFGFTSDTISFIKTTFQKKKYTIGVNLKNFILFSGWPGKYTRVPGPQMATLKYKEIFGVKDILGYQPEFIMSHANIIYTLDEKWDFHVYKANITPDVNERSKVERW